MTCWKRLMGLAISGAIVAACAGDASPAPISSQPSSTPTVGPSSALATTAPTSAPPAPPTEAPPPEWAELIPSDGILPAAREDHTMTVDPATGVAYLFGGRDGGAGMADLWSFDLARNRWQPLARSGDAPPGRFGHEAAWVDGVGLVVWAGQATRTRFLDDLWAYDPDSDVWTELPQPGLRPVARYGSCSGIGPDGRLWISHGFTADDGRFADTWAYDFEAGTWSETVPAGRGPVERCLHGCWWTDDGRFVLYAGQTTGVTALDDLWVLDGPLSPVAVWQRVDFERPPARNLYAFARDGASTVVVGGLGNDGYLADVFRLGDSDLVARPIEPTGTPPAPRLGASLIGDPERGRLVLFGGRSIDGAFDDAWSLYGT